MENQVPWNGCVKGSNVGKEDKSMYCFPHTCWTCLGSIVGFKRHNWKWNFRYYRRLTMLHILVFFLFVITLQHSSTSDEWLDLGEQALIDSATRRAFLRLWEDLRRVGKRLCGGLMLKTIGANPGPGRLLANWRRSRPRTRNPAGEETFVVKCWYRGCAGWLAWLLSYALRWQIVILSPL